MNFCYFSQLWPKQSFSAAHERTFGIIERFIHNNIKTYYITPQDKKKAEHIRQYIDLKCHQADPSNTSRVNHVLSRIQSPSVSVFDTHVSECLYSHYVHQVFQNCAKVLDLQDLHSLRLKRENLLTSELMNKEVLKAKPELGDELTDKEMAAIIRSDLIIACSDYEMELIKHLNKKVQLVTFFYPTTRPLDEEDKQAIELKQYHYKRRHFVFLGNMSHRPNYDAVKRLKDKIWPIIVKALPQAQLHIYGSNFPAEFKTDEYNGFICKGLMKEIDILGKYRVMLAPLRFGAGVKGKITDAWREMLPVITTPIGAEGLFLESSQAIKYECVNQIQSKFYSDMEPDRLTPQIRKESLEEENFMKEYYTYDNTEEMAKKLTFGGSFNNWTDEQFADEAIKMYQDEQLWFNAVDNSQKILKRRMDTIVNEKLLMKAISETQTNLASMRRQDILQKLTWSETLRSNYHFAKYLDEKRKNLELTGKLKQIN
ncbi:unnamed protein product [Paramecium pentaurelia]|uniref:Glycosyltransferase n=1 Tax=Paramecium pentaurelia TaxID=43138 RepID=A0A8S1W582_9CILI|nr:unnamed protein product [Paramecium pentaurelia]